MAKIINRSNATINPAIEEKQDDIISILTDGNSITTIVDSEGNFINPATSEKQEEAITQLEIIAEDTTSIDGKINTFTEGGQERLIVTDDNSRELLNEMLKQQKMTNLYLSVMTDIQLDKEEIE